MNQELFETIYQTIVNKEPTYDGIYYTGVKTTGIVCRPSCRAKTPKRDNIAFYTALEAAVADGFRPCKRCRPEAGGKLNPDAALAADIDNIIADRYSEQLTLASIAGQLMVSPYHMQRIYKRIRGITPLEQLHQIRLSAACRQLREGTYSILEIAERIGFRSASHFSSWFKARTGCQPSEYRKRYS